MAFRETIFRPTGILSPADQLAIDAEVQRLGRGLTQNELHAVVAQIARAKGEKVQIEPAPMPKRTRFI